MNLTRLQVDWPVNLSMPHQDRWLHTYCIARVCSGVVPFLLILDISWWVTKLVGDKWAAVNQVDALNDLQWVVWFSVTGRTVWAPEWHASTCIHTRLSSDTELNAHTVHVSDKSPLLHWSVLHPVLHPHLYPSNRRPQSQQSPWHLSPSSPSTCLFSHSSLLVSPFLLSSSSKFAAWTVFAF